MTRAQSNEHLRNFTQKAYEEKRTRNFDPTREHLNFEVLPGGVIAPLNKKYAIDVRIKNNLEERGIKDPNEGLKDEDKKRCSVVDIILQGSRDRMRELAFGNVKIDTDDGDHVADNRHVQRKPEIEEWAKDMYNFVKDKYGEKNIVAFVVHLDEKNPHVHCTLIPTGNVKGKERISLRSLFGKDKYEFSRTLKRLHDELAEVNQKWGLERGRSITETGAKHRTTEEYWKELTEACNSLERKSNDLQDNLDVLNAEIKKAEKRVKGLTTMIGNLEEQYRKLEEDISYLEAEKDKGEEDREMLSDDIQKMKSELEEIKAKIDDKMQKLNKAEQQLWELGGKRKELQDDMMKLNRQINRLSPEAENKTIEAVKSLAWDMTSIEARRMKEQLTEYRNQLTPEDQNKFDTFSENFLNDTIFDDMAERANEIVVTAASLFMGYLDQATTFAQSKGGGGGGGSTSGWGKKKDEDDRAFMARCFGMARIMMHPAGRKIKR